MTAVTRRTFLCGIALIPALQFTTARAQTGVSPEEARAIAKEAYIYGFPMVDNYRIEHAYFVDTKNPEYKGPWNHLVNIARVYTPADTAIQSANSDTPYSFVGLDLRAEPMVLTVPPIEKDRYFSIQFIDAYTFNFAYIGSRATGNDGGSFLVAGPGWKGETPKGVKEVIRSETELVLAAYRTQLFNPDDLDNVKKIQSEYKAEPLSKFLDQAAPAAAPAIDFIKPLSPDDERTSPEFFNILNFVLQYCPTDPSETDLMARFAKIGVGAGKTIDISSPEMKTAIEQGMADAWADLGALRKQIDAGKITFGELFGTRQYLKNNYLYRMGAAVLGIYGNSKQEAMYPVYAIDADGKKLDGANKYTVHFEADKMPPVNAFWSLTMYDLPQSLLVANPINRYLLNLPMLPQFVKDADGGLTFYIQNETPGKDKEPNWLPAPKGPFVIAMRLYWPKEAALDGEWKQPPMKQSA
ncbi:cell envelope protein [Phyllobacterium brassicacearum]|uniref:Cell envelope protein n=2 Tax=Phyllobacterium brassicacearum TaxID=314235 RepID=A0A2P7BQL4_9HYPH|nr:cell envelope protein [Phyllobacterium brassicacearum]